MGGSTAATVVYMGEYMEATGEYMAVCTGEDTVVMEVLEVTGVLEAGMASSAGKTSPHTSATAASTSPGTPSASTCVTGTRSQLTSAHPSAHSVHQHGLGLHLLALSILTAQDSRTSAAVTPASTIQCANLPTKDRCLYVPCFLLNILPPSTSFPSFLSLYHRRY